MVLSFVQNFCDIRDKSKRMSASQRTAYLKKKKKLISVELGFLLESLTLVLTKKLKVKKTAAKLIC